MVWFFPVGVCSGWEGAASQTSRELPGAVRWQALPGRLLSWPSWFLSHVPAGSQGMGLIEISSSC